MEDLFYVDIDDILARPITELRDEILLRCQNSLEALDHDDHPELLQAGDPDIASFRYEINSIRVERIRHSIECTIGGDFDASLSASIVRINWRDEGLQDLQGESTVSGEFSFVLVGDLLDTESQAEAGDILVEVGDELHWLE